MLVHSQTGSYVVVASMVCRPVIHSIVNVCSDTEYLRFFFYLLSRRQQIIVNNKISVLTLLLAFFSSATLTRVVRSGPLGVDIHNWCRDEKFVIVLLFQIACAFLYTPREVALEFNFFKNISRVLFSSALKCTDIRISFQ